MPTDSQRIRGGGRPPRAPDRARAASRTWSGSAPRAAALDVLIAVLCEGHSLQRALEARSPLPEPRDNALVKEICYGVLRRRRPLEEVLNALLHRRLPAGDAELRIALLIGLYQLIYTRIGPHAAVATTTALGRRLGKARAAALINGVLRSFLRRQGDLSGRIARTQRPEHSHPPWLSAAIRDAWPTRWREILLANDARAPMTLRVNARRVRRREYLQRLGALGHAARPAAHCDHGLTLDRPVDVLDLPGFPAGEVSVQDAAAQLAAPLLDPVPGTRLLDACAAPGGKAAHLLERCPSLRLTALDIDAERTRRVESTLARLRLSAELRCADAGEPARWWDGLPYQAILVDAPCSATGVIRRHPDIKWLRRPEDPLAFSGRQLRLVASLWTLLARGGSLLYATCSVLPAENDDVVTRFLGTRPDAKPVAIDASWGIATRHGRQILPGEEGMDGFYYARLIKV